MRTSCGSVTDADRAVADLLAVAQADEVVGDAEDLVELVGDEDDRPALGLELRDDAEEIVDLVGRKCSGRLVHDDDLRLVRQRPRDLDQVLLRDRKALQLEVGRDRRIDALQQLGRTRRASAASPRAATNPTGMWPMKMFSATREFVEHHRFLVDRGDARAPRRRAAMRRTSARRARGPRPRPAR